MFTELKSTLMLIILRPTAKITAAFGDHIVVWMPCLKHLTRLCLLLPV